MALGLTVSNLVVGRFFRVRLNGETRVPPRAVAGGMVRLTVTIHNPSARPAFDLEATLDSVVSGLGAARESLRIDRLDPGQSGSLEVTLIARKRGVYTLGPAFVGTTYPLGIVRQGRALGAPGRLLVTPRIHAIRQFRLPSGMRHQPGGVPMASQTGESLEFVGVRDYRSGDSPRKIHWKLWARRGVPVVREFSQEYFSRVGIILDTYRPPQGAHFEAALEVVASLAGFLQHSDSIVDFFAAGPQLFLLSMGRNLGSLERVLEVLACLEPCQASPYASLKAQLCELVPRLSALVLVTFSPTLERSEFVQSLRLAGAPLRVLAVAPPRFRGQSYEADLSWLDPSQLGLDLESV